VIKRDVGVRLYAIPVAVVGAFISSYHYLLEWFPELDSGACVVGTPCTTVWFREFGFVSIPFLALIAFLLVIVLLLVPSRRQAAEPEVEDSLEEDDV
jgi:disulfide bond formation protein DsbB